jgi:hypothetical protein
MSLVTRVMRRMPAIKERARPWSACSGRGLTLQSNPDPHLTSAAWATEVDQPEPEYILRKP